MLLRRLAIPRVGITLESTSEDVIPSLHRLFSSASDVSSSDQHDAGQLRRKDYGSSPPKGAPPSPRKQRVSPPQSRDDRQYSGKGKNSQQGHYRKGRDNQGTDTGSGDIVEDMMKADQKSWGKSFAPLTSGQKIIAQTIAPHLLDTEMLHLLKYIMPKGRREDRKTTINKLRANMFRDPNKVSRRLQQEMLFESKPNYRIEEIFGSTPSAIDAPLPSPEKTLDEAKEKFCAVLGLSDAEFEKYKEMASKDFRENTLPKVMEMNPKVQEKELQRLVDECLQPDHKHYQSIISKLKTLHQNPYWPFERKVTFVKRLLKSVAM